MLGGFAANRSRWREEEPEEHLLSRRRDDPVLLSESNLAAR